MHLAGHCMYTYGVNVEHTVYVQVWGNPSYVIAHGRRVAGALIQENLEKSLHTNVHVY